MRILATCRWPLGLQAEYPLEVTPLTDGDALDLFAANLEQPQHRAQTAALRGQSGSIVHQIAQLSGRHPQSLRLLARQLARPGMTLEELYEEARRDLLKVLADPLAADNEQDRQKKVAVSYELSYRHLSEPAQRLFQRLAFLPGGVWCGELAEQHLPWTALLGEQWRELLEKELDFFALVHYEPEADGVGTFAMLPPMREFARSKYQQRPDAEWEQRWLDFWRARLSLWDNLLSGKVPDDATIPDHLRGEAGRTMQAVGKSLYEHTYANWRAVFDYCEQQRPNLVREVLLNTANYTTISGNLLLGRELAERAVRCLRQHGGEADLAACLVTLANRLGALGERPAARGAYEEALGIHRRLAARHPAAYEPNVATTLNNLGNVLVNLGEHPAARGAYEEALTIYWPFVQELPQAFGQNFLMVLGNYVGITDETDTDPWWQLWRGFQNRAAD